MATTIGTIIARARRTLLETSANFWTDDELLDHARNGCVDLWKGIIDVYQDHFLKINRTDVSLPANASTASGVPSDCFRIKFIEPRDLDTHVNTFFEPRDYNDGVFRRLRTLSPQDPSGTVFAYDLVGAGPPVDTPELYISPKVSSELPLTVGYIAGIPALTTSSNNPIPGETDHALEAWIVAWARAKEREDRSPDPEWIKIYGDEKQGILTAVTPRQEDEPEYVQGLFEEYD